MGKDSIEPFSTKGSQAEVQDQWKKWVRSFEYFLVAENITDPVRMKMLLMYKAGSEVQRFRMFSTILPIHCLLEVVLTTMTTIKQPFAA